MAMSKEERKEVEKLYEGMSRGQLEDHSDFLDRMVRELDQQTPRPKEEIAKLYERLDIIDDLIWEMEDDDD